MAMTSVQVAPAQEGMSRAPSGGGKPDSFGIKAAKLALECFKRDMGLRPITDNTPAIVPERVSAGMHLHARGDAVARPAPHLHALARAPRTHRLGCLNRSRHTQHYCCHRLPVPAPGSRRADAAALQGAQAR